LAPTGTIRFVRAGPRFADAFGQRRAAQHRRWLRWRLCSEQWTRVRVANEINAKELGDLALMPVGGRVDTDETRHATLARRPKE